MDIQKLVHDVAETLQRDANARAVFGEPVTLGEHTILPVAMVIMALGGGGGGLSPDPEKPMGMGGGGGLDVKTLPVGFIHESDGEVRFTAIPLPDAVAHEHAPGLIDAIKKRLGS
jgi:uncharacterized spore protein YtfJ